MLAYAKLHGGRLPPKKNIKATGSVLGHVKDALDRSSVTGSIYQQHYNLAERLLEGGAPGNFFRFGNIGGVGGVDVSDISL